MMFTELSEEQLDRVAGGAMEDVRLFLGKAQYAVFEAINALHGGGERDDSAPPSDDSSNKMIGTKG